MIPYYTIRNIKSTGYFDNTTKKFNWELWGLQNIRDGVPVLLLVAYLSKLINFYSPWSHQKTVGLLMISGGKKVN